MYFANKICCEAQLFLNWAEGKKQEMWCLFLSHYIFIKYVLYGLAHSFDK